VSGLNAYDRLVFELSSPGRVGFSLPESDVPAGPLTELVPEKYLRGAAAALPEVSEFDVVRHYSRLSRMNYGVDTHFYPLGSCTMKYNPKLNEDMARLAGFARLHPLVRDEDAQGALQLMYDLAAMLAEIAGMDAVSLQPAAGAQGEFAGVLMIRAYHQSRGEKRTKVQSAFRSHRSEAVVKDIDINVNVGVAVPRSVSLYAVPEEVVIIVPEYRRYKFFIFGDKVVIVDPGTYEIVDVLILA